MLSLRTELPRPATLARSLPPWRPFVSKLAGWALPLTALAIGLLSLTTAHESAIGQYGLIQALPPLYFLSLGILATGFVLVWRRSRRLSPEFVLDLIILVVLLQGAPGIIESEPRFAAAWVHVGFTNFVAQTGRVLPGIDARFSWPSFFTGMALVDRTAGLPDAIILIRWWPVFINLLYLSPLFLLAKTLLRSEKQAMLAVWLFPFANWVGQDYYSPQSVGYLLYLVLLCVVLGPCGASHEGVIPLLWKKLRNRNQKAPTDSSLKEPADDWCPQAPAQVLTLLLVMVALCAAMDTGHQLTPVFAVTTVIMLAFFGRTRLLPWAGVMFLLAAGWICYGAATYWAGHLGTLFGGLSSVSSNYSGDLRLHGNAAHSRINDVRLLIVGIIYALAFVGFLVGRRMRADRMAVAVITLTPLCTIAGQAYGEEAGLRAFLFSLPGALCLAAMALTSAAPRLRVIFASVLTAALIPCFLLARWGNELSEFVRPAEISAMNALYKIAPPGSTMVALTPQITWEYTDIGRQYQYSPFPFLSGSVPNLAQQVSDLAGQLQSNPHGGYLIITISQLYFAQSAYGIPLSWGTDVEQALAQSHLFRLIYSNSDSKIYQVIGRK